MMCLFISATRKKAEQKKTGGGPAPPRHTPAEELALELNVNRPNVQGIPGSSSSLDPQPGSSSSSTFITGKEVFNSLCIGYCKIIGSYLAFGVIQMSATLFNW
jgi:hypothetical protein